MGKKKGKKGGKKKLKKEDLDKAVVNLIDLEDYENLKRDVALLKEENEDLRTRTESEGTKLSEQALVFTHFQDKVSRNKEYSRMLLDRLGKYEQLNLGLKNELEKERKSHQKTRDELDETSKTLSSKQKLIIEADVVLAQNNTLEVELGNLRGVIRDVKQELHARESQIKIIRKAERVADRQRKAIAKAKAESEGRGAEEGQLSLPVLPGASEELERRSMDDGEATDGSFSAFSEMNKPRPSLIPFVLEALKAQPKELSVQTEGIFLLMHLAEEVPAIKLIAQLGGLELVLQACFQFGSDATLLAHATRLFFRCAAHSDSICYALRRYGTVALLLECLSKHRLPSARRFFYNSCKCVRLLVGHTRAMTLSHDSANDSKHGEAPSNKLLRMHDRANSMKNVREKGSVYQEVADSTEVARILLVCLDWSVQDHMPVVPNEETNGGGDGEKAESESNEATAGGVGRGAGDSRSSCKWELDPKTQTITPAPIDLALKGDDMGAITPTPRPLSAAEKGAFGGDKDVESQEERGGDGEDRDEKEVVGGEEDGDEGSGGGSLTLPPIGGSGEGGGGTELKEDTAEGQHEEDEDGSLIARKSSRDNNGMHRKRRRSQEGKMSAVELGPIPAMAAVPISAMATYIVTSLVQALEVDKHDRVKRMVASSDAQVVIVTAMKRFITVPEVLVPCCLLLRHGLSEERAPRRDQISSLQSLQLVQLLLAVNKSPLHLIPTVNTEVCALLSALDVSIGTVGEFM